MKVEQEAVRQTIQIRTKALNTRDLTLYFSVISSTYHDEKGRDFSRIREDLSAGFITYDSVLYQPDEQTLRVHGKWAELKGTYRMKLVIHGRQVLLDGKERMVLMKEAGGWKITSGL